MGMEASSPFVLTDQLGREVRVKGIPRRIVSLVPSQTELLSDLGLDEEVVGITKFCIHPDGWTKRKSIVGGTKDFKTTRIRELAPDLIIANKEENTKETLEELMDEFPVWVSDVNSLEDALQMIGIIGSMTGRAKEAVELISAIRSGFDQLSDEVENSSYRKRVVYYIWKDPWLTAGSDTFIQDMLRRCRFIPVPDMPRYPELKPGDLPALKSDLVLLSSEPYPFKEEHRASFKGIIPEDCVQVVDGEMFSWYGSRLLQSPAYFNRLMKTLQPL